MKIRGLIVSVVIATLFLGACAKSSVSGINKKQGIHFLCLRECKLQSSQSDSLNLNPMVIAKAMIDGQKANPPCRMKQQVVLL
jgi:hypothetical protein